MNHKWASTLRYQSKKKTQTEKTNYNKFEFDWRTHMKTSTKRTILAAAISSACLLTAMPSYAEGSFTANASATVTTSGVV